MDIRIVFFIFLLAFLSCNQQKKLPILGPVKTVDGEMIFHTIPPFSYRNQDSILVTNQTLQGKVYIADFFYSYCPTICPVVKKETMRVYEAYKDDPRVVFVSITLDPKHDNVSYLHTYAQNLGVRSQSWHFLTGNKAQTYQLAQKGFLVSALEDSTQPGGVVHSGALTLIDGQGQIRGYYDGTKPQAITDLLFDLPLLLKETKPQK